MVTQPIRLLFGREGMPLAFPEHAVTLRAAHPPALARPGEALRHALEHPIASASLAELLAKKRPRTAAITISDITRPVPNRIILPALLDILSVHGIADARVTIVVGTGMHRPSTPQEHLELVGPEILQRVRVVDHRADAADTLVNSCVFVGQGHFAD